MNKNQKKFLKRLAAVWEKNPDLRFGQLIENVPALEGSNYYTPDDIFISELEEFYKKNGKR